jgi:TetR/AcrR family transcriptional repressor of nem operon
MIGNFVELRSDLVPGGCPLMNTAIESDDGNPILRARARKALQSWASRLSKIIRRGIAHRQINSTIHPQNSATHHRYSRRALLISRLQKVVSLHDARKHLDEYLEHNVRSKARRN